MAHGMEGLPWVIQTGKKGARRAVGGFCKPPAARALRGKFTTQRQMRPRPSRGPLRGIDHQPDFNRKPTTQGAAGDAQQPGSVQTKGGLCVANPSCAHSVVIPLRGQIFPAKKKGPR